MKEPYIQVGIINEPRIAFTLLNTYLVGSAKVNGKQVVECRENRIYWNNQYYDELCFEPSHEATDAFELNDVTIGINFHWERKEDQRFLGKLKRSEERRVGKEC